LLGASSTGYLYNRNPKGDREPPTETSLRKARWAIKKGHLPQRKGVTSRKKGGGCFTEK